MPWLAESLREAAAAALEPVSLSAQPLPPPDSPIVVVALRDERLRVEPFLDHYRAAGIRRFCCIDNGSSDGTPEWLAAQPDVDLLRTERRYGEFAKQGWIIEGVRRYEGDRWFLWPDADELFVFDGIESRGFGDLARAMDARGVRRVRGILLDMYPEGSLAAAAADARHPLEAAPFHDGAGFAEVEGLAGMSIFGGPRRRLLADPRDRGSEMSKVPMFRRSAGELPAHAHYLWPLSGNATAPRHLALLHLKFLGDARARAGRALERGGYTLGAKSYRSIANALDADPALSLHGSNSRRYTGSRGLVEAGLIAAVPWDGAEVPAPPPDGAVSRLVPEMLSPQDAALLRRAAEGVEAVSVSGLGPEALAILRQGRRRMVAVEADPALIDAFARRPVPARALAASDLTLLPAAPGPEAAMLPWPAWAAEGRWPGLVLIAGRYRVASALAALREAAARGVPAGQVAILFSAFHPAHPEYAGLEPFVELVARDHRLALLRGREAADPAALDAAFAAHRDDPR